jgi:hypothetical protein
MNSNHGNAMGPINPASGFTMMDDDCSGVDVAGNPYGMSAVDPFESLFGDSFGDTMFSHDSLFGD